MSQKGWFQLKEEDFKKTSPNLLLRAQNLKVIQSSLDLDINASQACLVHFYNNHEISLKNEYYKYCQATGTGPGPGFGDWDWGLGLGTRNRTYSRTKYQSLGLTLLNARSRFLFIPLLESISKSFFQRHIISTNNM